MLVALYADDTSIYSRRDSKSNLFDKVKMAADIQNDFQFIVNWGQ